MEPGPSMMQSEKAAGKQKETEMDRTERIAREEMKKLELTKWRMKKLIWEHEGEGIDRMLEKIESW